MRANEFITESASAEHKQKALDAAMDVLEAIVDALDTELGTSFDDVEAKSDRLVSASAGDYNTEYPAIMIGFDITSFVVQDKTQAVAEGSLVLDTQSGAKEIMAVITSAMGNMGMKLTWGGSPWRFNDHARYTAKFKLMEFEPEAKAPSTSYGSGDKYDPRAAFNARPGERARQARVAGSAYGDSFGGDSSNYR